MEGGARRARAADLIIVIASPQSRQPGLGQYGYSLSAHAHRAGTSFISEGELRRTSKHATEQPAKASDAGLRETCRRRPQHHRAHSSTENTNDQPEKCQPQHRELCLRTVSGSPCSLPMHSTPGRSSWYRSLNYIQALCNPNIPSKRSTFNYVAACRP